MEQQDRKPDVLIQEAAFWVLKTPKAERPRPTVVEIRERFPQIGALGACQALHIVNLVKSGGADATA